MSKKISYFESQFSLKVHEKEKKNLNPNEYASEFDRYISAERYT